MGAFSLSGVRVRLSVPRQARAQATENNTETTRLGFERSVGFHTSHTHSQTHTLTQTPSHSNRRLCECETRTSAEILMCSIFARTKIRFFNSIWKCDFVRHVVVASSIIFSCVCVQQSCLVGVRSRACQSSHDGGDYACVERKWKILAKCASANCEPYNSCAHMDGERVCPAASGVRLPIAGAFKVKCVRCFVMFNWR